MQRHSNPFPEIAPAFGHWLAGFVDGEGCFYLGGASGRAFAVVSFSITLRADDQPILDTIREETGIGDVFCRMPTQGPEERDGRRDHPQARWVVTRKRECQRLVEIFDRFPLRAKKARDFAIWREAVRYHASIVQGAQGINAPDWEPMRTYARELRRVRQFDADTDPAFFDRRRRLRTQQSLFSFELREASDAP